MAKEARPRNQPLLTDEEFAARRPVLLEGIRQFNDGYYFESHETWEDLWLPTPWPARQFLQGLIQIAAAFVHLMRGEYPGTIRLLDEALVKLAEFPGDFLDIDAVQLQEDAGRARDEIAALGAERFRDWDRSRIPHIRLLGPSDQASP